MDSKAKLLGHPIHQILIVFPLGLLATAAGFDLFALFRQDGPWSLIAYYLIAVGVASGLVAAVFGLVDYLAVPRGTRARYIGTLHGIGNVVVVALFAASWLLRRPAPSDPAAEALIFSFLGVAMAAGTGWLGGELVSRLGVGVDDGAHLNSPSSLSGRAAGESRTIRTFAGPERRHEARAFAGAERRTT